MKIELALAADNYVAKLPKGAKVTAYEVLNPRSNKMLDKGTATTMKQVLNRLAYVAPSGMTVDVTVFAEHDGDTIKVKDAYIVKANGATKVN